jgi:hypothetical protein
VFQLQLFNESQKESKIDVNAHDPLQYGSYDVHGNRNVGAIFLEFLKHIDLVVIQLAELANAYNFMYFPK